MELYPPTDWTKHPLHLAAMSSNREAVELLISQGSDVNENLFLEGTPLHIAVCHCPGGWFYAGKGHVAVVRLLLENGANIHAKRESSGTPLHDAAAEGDTTLAEILLAHGADINSQQECDCRTPLHRAVEGGKQEMVQFLISRAADVNLIADCEVPIYSNAHLLESRCFPELGMTPLHVAARDGKWDITQLLLSAGAVKNIKVSEVNDGRDRRSQGLTAFDLALNCTNRLEERARESRRCLTLLKDAIAP